MIFVLFGLLKLVKDVKKIFIFFLLPGAVLLFISGCNKPDNSSGTVTDAGGNVYKTVLIGEQVWMAENLRTSILNDGTEVPLITNAETWSSMDTPGYSWYNNDEASYREPYGALYNGYAVSTGMLCPVGWHVPDKFEWQELRLFLGDSISGGGKLKEAGTYHWLAPNEGADNSSGFTALPAGLRYFEGSYSSVLQYASFWSSTGIGINDLWYLGLYYNDASINMNHRSAKHGFSVRCIKD